MHIDKKPKEVLLSLSKDKGDFLVSCSRSSGHGGQNVNKRDTKVRITHPKSGAIGESQTHKTQGMNKKEAFKRLLDSKKFKDWLRVELAKLGIQGATNTNNGPVGSRGERIRTYNYPRDEVVDHRINVKLNGVQQVLDGDLDQLVLKLRLNNEGIDR